MADDDVKITLSVKNKDAIRALQAFTRELNKTTDKVDEDLDKMKKSSSKVGTLTKAIKSYWGEVLVATGAVYGLVRAVSDLTQAYSRQEEADRKLHQVLVSTGRYTPTYEKKLKDLADQFQNLTMYGNETVETAESIMLTFRNVGEDVFPTAIEAAMNMSTMFGQDLKQSVIQLGTALNDPIQGVGRLRRIGISFTEAQKEMIKNFMEQNDLASAQKVILDELDKEIGGTAKAMGDTYAGNVAKLKNAVGDLKETIGGLIVNQLNPLIPLMINIVNNINEWIEAKKRLKKAYEDVKKSIKDVSDLERSEYLQSKILVKQMEVEIAKRALMAGKRSAQAKKLREEYQARLRELETLKRVKAVWDEYVATQKEAEEAERKEAEQKKKQTETSKQHTTALQNEYVWNSHIAQIINANEGLYRKVAIVKQSATDSSTQLTKSTQKEGDAMKDTANKTIELTTQQQVLYDLQQQLSDFMVNTFKNSFVDSWEAIWTTTGDTSKKVKEAVKDLFVSLLKAIGKQYAILAITAALAFAWGQAAKYTALSIAAYLAAGVISKLQQGGIVHAQQGYGGGDTVPAMLEPGEMVIRKEVVQQNRATLEAMNSGQPAPTQIIVYLGTKKIYDEISRATTNGQLIIDKRAVK